MSYVVVALNMLRSALPSRRGSDTGDQMEATVEMSLLRCEILVR
jgi:hypothetical protein